MTFTKLLMLVIILGGALSAQTVEIRVGTLSWTITSTPQPKTLSCTDAQGTVSHVLPLACIVTLDAIPIAPVSFVVTQVCKDSTGSVIPCPVPIVFTPSTLAFVAGQQSMSFAAK